MSFNYVFLLLLIINFKFSSNENIVSEVNKKGVSVANNYFAINLLKQLADQNTNVLFSPFCITTLFNMLYFGANGRTSEEIEEVFGLRLTNLTKQEIGDQYRQLFDDLFGDDLKSELFAANLLVAQNRNAILNEYEKQLKDYFNSSLKTVDFLFKSDEAVQQINELVAESTRGKIEELLAEPLSPLSVLLVLNAVYFKGQWRQQFLKWATKEEDFKVLNKAIKVSQMKLSQPFNYTTVGPLSQSQLIEVPYSGREDGLAMYVLLPPEHTDVRQFADRLTAQLLDEAIGNLSVTTVRLILPKFTIATHYDLKSTLQTLGLTQAFTYKSDLSAIDGTNYLHVSQVYHKSVLEVTEEGSEPEAGARGQERGLFGRYRNVPTFRADHPFFFFVRHKRSAVILFAGLLNKP